MKIRSVTCNNRKKAFQIKSARGTLLLPYSKVDIRPSGSDPVARVFVNKELGGEGFTYVLASGKEGTVHGEQVLEYNQDPTFLRDALLYKLTIEAQKRIEKSPLSKREIIRRLRTSATQLYRLLDQTNYRKSVDQLLSLLHVLDCDVDLLVRSRSSSGKAA
ncbi:MAG: helix-turn-helix domain-containing protein [Nitrospira sp.]|nr:helix-turn-helix domain-containing protein [Nitrospira sp.]